MTNEASDHDLMHREDHASRTACAGEDKTSLDHFAQLSAFAAETRRHKNSHQALLLGGAECFFRKTAIAVDGNGMRRSYGCDGLCALAQFVGCSCGIRTMRFDELHDFHIYLHARCAHVVPRS